MNSLRIKVKSFSLDKTLKSEQCVADLFFLDESTNSWVTYIPVQNIWSKVTLKQPTKNKLTIEFDQSELNETPRAKARGFLSPITIVDQLHPRTKVRGFKFGDNKNELISKIKQIFSLNVDISEGFSKKYKNDKYLMKIYQSSFGIRIMNDINNEYRIIESILTQNTSVKMVKTMQRNLFLHYGKRIKIDNESIYTYPNINKIANDDIESIKNKIRCGYRAKYIKNMAQNIITKELDIDTIDSLATNQAREYLLNFKGIGPKVADLILMYGFNKNDVFPADIWVRKTLGSIYFNNRIPTVKESVEFAKEYFGNYASLINLMIFYHERKDKTEFINTNVWNANS